MFNGQELAWIFSSLSNVLWLFVFVPQFYENYKSKRSDAISLSLILCLIFGDLFSLLSAITKELNNVIIYTIIYHIILDLFVVCQIMYYRIYNILLERRLGYENVPLFDENYTSPLEYTYIYLTFSEFLFTIFGIISVLICQVFLTILKDNNSILLADLIAWGSIVIFASARIPQILLNNKRKSTNGLSLLSFIIINIANSLFLLSILVILLDIPQNNHMNYIKNNIQWISGSFFTTMFDLIIFYQFYIYGRKTNLPLEIEEIDEIDEIIE